MCNKLYVKSSYNAQYKKIENLNWMNKGFNLKLNLSPLIHHTSNIYLNTNTKDQVLSALNVFS